MFFELFSSTIRRDKFELLHYDKTAICYVTSIAII